MDLLTIILIAFGLATDAFFVAITKGIVIKSTVKHGLIIALFFGGFQAIMTILGWIFGIPLETFFSTFASWIAFILISAVGIKMIYESFSEDEDDKHNFSLNEIFFLAIATSIDAFVVGISFALLKTPNIRTSHYNRRHCIYTIIHRSLYWQKIRISIWKRNRNSGRRVINWNRIISPNHVNIKG